MEQFVRKPSLQGRPVVLAHELDFPLGEATVRPSRLLIECGGRSERVEPRVMQVLVGLVRADGAVVTRDELIDSCWEGRIVGEDAIQRVLGRLRHLGNELANGSFQIETVRGVGCRLVEAEQPPLVMAGPDRIADRRPAVSRRIAIAGFVATTAAASTGIWLFRRPAHEPAPLARQYYQRGLETRGQNNLELSQRGAALFRQATRIDPEFADAWGALAWSYRGLLEYESATRSDPARLEALSRSAAARALELNPDNADAQAALLLLKPFFGNWTAMEEGCRRLLKRHPRHSILEWNLGFTLTEGGRWRESVRYFRAVAERERFWPLAHLALIRPLFCSGRVQEAEDLLDDGLKRFPGHIDYWLMKVRNLTISGRLPEALAFARDRSNWPAERSAIQPEIEFEMSLLDALADGSLDARSAVMRKISGAARQFPTYIGHAAVTAGMLGDLDASFAMLEGHYFGEGPWAFTHRRRARTTRLFIPETFPLRADPRFSALLRRTGLEDYWRSTGTAPDYRRYPEPEYRLPVG